MSRNYEANVTFEVWSQGGDPDLIDRDRVWESERESPNPPALAVGRFKRSETMQRSALPARSERRDGIPTRMRIGNFPGIDSW
jgi:hypothetical protein